MIDALEIASERRVDRGGDKSFAALCDYWLKVRVPQKKSGANDRYMIRRYLGPAFGHPSLCDITPVQVEDYKVERLTHLEPQTVRHHLSLLGSMWSAARRDHQWVERALRIVKPKVRWHSKSFRYLKLQKILAHRSFEMTLRYAHRRLRGGLRSARLGSAPSRLRRRASGAGKRSGTHPSPSAGRVDAACHCAVVTGADDAESRASTSSVTVTDTNHVASVPVVVKLSMPLVPTGSPTRNSGRS